MSNERHFRDRADRRGERFLQRLGKHYPHSGTLYLLGGAALCLLGSPRRTVDIDYTVEAPPDKVDELRAAIEAVAREMQLELEDVPNSGYTWRKSADEVEGIVAETWTPGRRTRPERGIFSPASSLLDTRTHVLV